MGYENKFFTNPANHPDNSNSRLRKDDQEASYLGSEMYFKDHSNLSSRRETYENASSKVESHPHHKKESSINKYFKNKLAKAIQSKQSGSQDPDAPDLNRNALL